MSLYSRDLAFDKVAAGVTQVVYHAAGHLFGVKYCKAVRIQHSMWKNWRQVGFEVLKIGCSEFLDLGALSKPALAIYCVGVERF